MLTARSLLYGGSAWQNPPLDRDHYLDRDPQTETTPLPRQRPPRTETPLTETPQTETFVFGR